MGLHHLPHIRKAGPVVRKQFLLGFGFSLTLKSLKFLLSAFRGPVTLLATVEICVLVGFLSRVFRLLLGVVPAQRTGFLPFTRVLAMVLTVFAAAWTLLVATFRPIVLVTVAAV